MEDREEIWDVCPHYEQNFVCKLNNRGRWDRNNFKKETPVFGKWIFFIEPKGWKTAPTLGDQRNFFTGLFEAEWRNDNNFEIGRPPQRKNKIDTFHRILKNIAYRDDVKDMERGISYYIKKCEEDLKK